MRLTTILLLTALLPASARTSAQTLTFSGKAVPIARVFSEIRKQTGYVCFFNKDFLSGEEPVTVHFDHTTLRDALDSLLANKPLTFDIQGNTIVIKRALSPPAPAADTSRPPAPPAEIRGTVMDESGRPLSGANVTVKETGRGTITNAKGEFVCTRVPSNSSLVFSFIGYAQETRKIREAGKDLKIFLKVATNELDKVVIQAYGTTTQRLKTGNIATVTAEEIERQPVMNAMQALEGRVPGVVVTQTDGNASSVLNIEIRGRAVLDQSTTIAEPLYIIDGVPLTILSLLPVSYEGGGNGIDQVGMSPAKGQSPFFSLNPGDIEAITILKDADATAIYGSRGANGVILITTKHGKAGKTKLDMSVTQGENYINQRYHLMNTQQYLAMRREAFKNDGIRMTAANAYDLLIWDTTRYTNWQNVYLSGTGHFTDAELSLSGGDQYNLFRLGAGYARSTTPFTRSGAEQRGSFNFNYTHKSLNQRLTITLTPTYSVGQSDLKVLGGNITGAPDGPPIFDQQGKLNWSGWQPKPGLLNNWAGLLQPYHQRTEFLNTQVSLRYQLLKSLSFTTQFGYSFIHGQQQKLEPIEISNPFQSSTITGTSFLANNNITNVLIEPQLEYRTDFGNNHKLSILIGATNQGVDQDYNKIEGDGYINDLLLRSLASAPVKRVYDGYGQYRYAAVFARINYNWQDKYIINLTGRRDGSSRFGPGKQYGSFGAVGLAWIFTEEGFIKRALPFLSFGKLRASYGLTGNDDIGNYGYLTQWSSDGITPYQGASAYVPLHLANPDLHWETNKKLELAANLGFFRDRLTAEIVYYRNRCGDQLVYAPLPILTGFGGVTENSPANVQNAGIEITMGGKIVDGKDFSLAANFNIGANRNKLIAFPNLAKSQYAQQFSIGKSLSIVRLLHYTGVDPQTGQYAFLDKNHDGTISSEYNNGNNDLFDKDLAIKFEGGLGLDLRYKDLKVNLFFNFRKTDRISPVAFYGSSGVIGRNQSTVVIDNHWQKPGDHAQFARYTTTVQDSDRNFYSSDGIYTDASFLRLRNIAVSYDLPFRKKTNINKCSIFLKANNIFVWTRYPAIDPQSTYGAYPLMRTITGGIQINL